MGLMHKEHIRERFLDQCLWGRDESRIEQREAIASSAIMTKPQAAESSRAEIHLKVVPRWYERKSFEAGCPGKGVPS